MMIACTQPQQVAVMSVSRRVVEEIDVTIGEQVGYRIPFVDCTTSRTVLKKNSVMPYFMAEGYGTTGRAAIEEGMAPLAGLPLKKA
ncbi:putative pre-mRNA-splicing factor ATP-dependent RNA helicase-like, partial [Trifolium medium]|nr:putative pre-mRNA-splicing factor ATP-dependent RNA helicase-like [Trifolium medium]